MQIVTVSSKFRIVIPQEMRKALGLKPGTKLQVLQYDNRLELIPLREPKDYRGFLKGIDTDGYRADY